MGKTKVTKDTEFIRSESFKDVHEGEPIEVTLACQPYVIGIYASFHVNGKHMQSSFTYDAMAKIVKNREEKLKAEGKTDVVVHIAKLGDYLSESDIAMIN